MITTKLTATVFPWQNDNPGKQRPVPSSPVLPQNRILQMPEHWQRLVGDENQLSSGRVATL